MTTEEIAQAMRDAFDRRKPHEMLVSSVTSERDAFGYKGFEIHFTYKGGNDYVPISELIADFKAFGEVLVEYRGVGTREEPTIVFDVTPRKDELVKLVYHLPNHSA